MRKPQNVNAVDEFGSACEPNVYHLCTLDIHSVRAVSVKKGIKLSVAENHCLENTPVGYGFDNQYPGSRGSLAHLWRRCHYNLGQVELVCETQGKCYTLEFQRLIEKIMVSQPPLLHGSDCVKLGLIEIKGSTSLSVQSARCFDRN